MTAFDHAWIFLKALPQQQMYEESLRPGFFMAPPEFKQQILGTTHPAIVGMLRRLQNSGQSPYGVTPDLEVLSSEDAQDYAADEEGRNAIIEARTPLTVDKYGEYFDDSQAYSI